MNNNSYVYIPANKLVEIIEHCERLEYEDCDGRSCIDCWKSWLKDGE